MYGTISNKKEQVFEIQTYLRALSKEIAAIPEVIPDGIYGAKTAEAVKAFQKQYGLPITGKVDSATWNLLYDTHMEIKHKKSAPAPIHPFCSSHKVEKGEHHNLVYIIQVMLDTVSSEYSFPEKIAITGSYDDATFSAIQQFQATVQLPPTGIVDKFTWNYLAVSYDKYNR